jgi:hypothetical protein
VRELVAGALRLVWVDAHRYLLADLCQAGKPVFSIVPSDMIVWGAYLRSQFLAAFADLLGLDRAAVRKEAADVMQAPFLAQFPLGRITSVNWPFHSSALMWSKQPLNICSVERNILAGVDTCFTVRLGILSQLIQIKLSFLAYLRLRSPRQSLQRPVCLPCLSVISAGRPFQIGSHCRSPFAPYPLPAQ